VLPHSPGDAPAPFDGHARPPSISAFTTQQRSDFGPDTKLARHPGDDAKTLVSWIVFSTLPIPAADLRGVN
jgi:hypothetical protein